MDEIFKEIPLNDRHFLYTILNDFKTSNKSSRNFKRDWVNDNIELMKEISPQSYEKIINIINEITMKITPENKEKKINEYIENFKQLESNDNVLSKPETEIDATIARAEEDEERVKAESDAAIARANADAETASAEADAARAKANADAEIASAEADAARAKANADAEIASAEADAARAKANAEKAKAEADKMKAEADAVIAKAEADAREEEIRMIRVNLERRQNEQADIARAAKVEMEHEEEQEKLKKAREETQRVKSHTDHNNKLFKDAEQREINSVENLNSNETKDIETQLNSIQSLINNDLNYIKLQISRSESELKLKKFDINGNNINELKNISPLLKNPLTDYLKIRDSFDELNGGTYGLEYIVGKPKNEKQILYEQKFQKLKKAKELLEGKLKAILHAKKKGIDVGSKILCEYTFNNLRTNQVRIGEVQDIYNQYIIGSPIPFTVLKYKNDETGKIHTNKLDICKLLTQEEKDKKRQEAIELEERTKFITSTIAARLGFKIGDRITCTDKKSNNQITGTAYKFKYNILKRKTYVILQKDGDTDEKKFLTVGVKYCVNHDDNILNKVDAIKNKKLMKKQISKLQKIISQINWLNINDPNYDLSLRNLNYEYNTIKNQIVEELKREKEKKQKEQNSPIQIQTHTEAKPLDFENGLKEIQTKRALLLELLQKTKPTEYYKMREILNRKIGGNVFGSTQKYSQKAGYNSISNSISNFIEIQNGLNNNININEVINNSQNLLDKINQII